MLPCVVDGSLLCVSHPVFDLRKCLLDRIEVRRVRWQEPEPCTGGFDHLTDGGRLVTAEIIHDDDVAWLEDGNQLLLDIGTKAQAVDRAVEDTRRCQPIVPQCTEECQSAPVAVWRKRPQTPAFWSPAPDGCHVGLDPGLVDEDEAFGI